MSHTHRLGDLQLAIMRVLWSRREATIAEVHAALERERGLALTTIATMLRKMEIKGIVDHRVDGRRFVYHPLIEESAVRRTMVGELADRLFGGDPAAMVSHLIREEEIDPETLDQIRRIIDERAAEEDAT